ncbi:hypothetical protein [Glaciibacter psychrotolerans]|uniref:Uncharacterized protein n=1 Tax=Glaciibacter psychrotolerans TaxID=670054 RepID=A0A7Z0J6P2_9MICO|nr:hypothetical protein [Leifsonia psychrotolerans]NYJ20737.1 hypothetical protein [Leifsonia psychrotolerans]
MNRVDIVYGGSEYSLGGRTAESIQQEITAAMSAHTPYWLPVNRGGGRFEGAFLLISTGIPIAVVSTRVSSDVDDDAADDDAVFIDSD